MQFEEFVTEYLILARRYMLPVPSDDELTRLFLAAAVVTRWQAEEAKKAARKKPRRKP